MSSPHPIKSTGSIPSQMSDMDLFSSRSPMHKKETEVESGTYRFAAIQFKLAEQTHQSPSPSPCPSFMPTFPARNTLSTGRGVTTPSSSQTDSSHPISTIHFSNLFNTSFGSFRDAFSSAREESSTRDKPATDSPGAHIQPEIQQAKASTDQPTEDPLAFATQAGITKEELSHFISITGVDPLKAWAFFIDADRWTIASKKPNPFLAFDEKEPGYMKGMLRAFNFLFDPRFSRGAFPLTPDTYAGLHDIAVDRVATRDGGLLEQGFRNNTRHSERFGLTDTTYSKEGGEELMVRKKSPAYRYTIHDDPDPYHVLNGYLELKYRDEATPKANATPTGDKRRALSQPSQTDLALLPEFISLKPITTEACRAKVAQCIQTYKEFMSAAEAADEKLKGIVRLCQDLDQIHVFVDGNIRTVNLLLNRLLYDNNLSFTCLWDPNCLDCLSEQELIQKVKEGQFLFHRLLPTPSVK